ncbi:MAG: peptidylprolyl isomerase [Pseudomonadota bacterium]
MRRSTICLFVSTLLFALPAILSAQEQRIAAIVNDDVVSAQDLSERLGLVLLTSRIQDQEQARRQLSPQVLRSLIEESLQLQEAKRLSIDVTPDELNRALADIASRNQMSPDQLEQMLASNRIDPKTLKNQLRAQISWLKIVNQRLRPQVNVTVDQLEIAVEEAKRNQGQPEYLLSEIVLPVDSPSDEPRVAADAARLVRTLSEGASFEALARQVSASATARNGGDVGWVPASTIPPELESALERLRPGDVSEPLRSPVGFYIFQLRDRRLGAAPSTEGGERTPIEVQLSQVLFEADIGNDEILSAKVDQANSLRTRLTDCAAVNAVAEELQAPASGDLGWLKVSDLPVVLANAVRELPEGEISTPLQGPGGVHLLMVCDRRGGDVPESGNTIASEEDRQRIAEQLERERLDRLARRYLRDLRKQAFIDIRI